MTYKEMGSSASDDDCYYAMQLISSSVLPMVMSAAIDLELLDIIYRAGEDARLSAKEIASKLPTKNPDAPVIVDRILRLLASHCVLTCTPAVDQIQGQPETLYGLAPVAKFYLKDREDISLVHSMQLIHERSFYDCWSALKDTVLEGGSPFDRVHGMKLFEYASKHPNFNQVFNKAMVSHTNLITRNVLLKYKGFEDINLLVDVGGGLGLTLSMITSKYPNIKAINYDLPHVIKQAPQLPGIEHAEGDMFASVPKGDAILLKCILHDWSDEYCLKLLKNCYDALPDQGKVIVIELMVPEAPEATAAARCTYQIDMVMLTHNPGGKERSKLEYEALAKKAGFKRIHFACFVINQWVIEFYKD